MKSLRPGDTQWLALRSIIIKLSRKKRVGQNTVVEKVYNRDWNLRAVYEKDNRYNLGTSSSFRTGL